MVSVTHRFLVQSELCSMSGGYSGLDGDESYWYRRLKHASRTCFASSPLSSFSPTFSTPRSSRPIPRVFSRRRKNTINERVYKIYLPPLFLPYTYRIVRNRIVYSREILRSMNENTSSKFLPRNLLDRRSFARASIIFFFDKSLPPRRNFVSRTRSLGNREIISQKMITRWIQG